MCPRTIAAACHSSETALSTPQVRASWPVLVQPLLWHATNLIPGTDSFDARELCDRGRISLPRRLGLAEPASACRPDLLLSTRVCSGAVSPSQDAAAESRTVAHLRTASNSVSQRPARHLGPRWRADCLSLCGVSNGQGSSSHTTHLGPSMVPESATLKGRRKTTRFLNAVSARPCRRLVPGPAVTHMARQHAPPLAGIDLKRRAEAAQLGTHGDVSLGPNDNTTLCAEEFYEQRDAREPSQLTPSRPTPGQVNEPSAMTALSHRTALLAYILLLGRLRVRPWPLVGSAGHMHPRRPLRGNLGRTANVSCK